MNLLHSAIALEDAPVLATGRDRLIFAHPSRPGFLIKVPAEKRDADRRLARFRRSRGARSSISEFREQRRLGPQRHLQFIDSFARTDFGLAIVVRAELDAGGGLAPRLVDLAAERSRTVRRLLDEFLVWVETTPVIIGDLHAGNIVLSNRDGGVLVLVDGYGSKTAIPSRAYIPALNASRNRKKADLLRLHLRDRGFHV